MVTDLKQPNMEDCMKTEELKAQGLTQEQINFVMAENGKGHGNIYDTGRFMQSARHHAIQVFHGHTATTAHRNDE